MRAKLHERASGLGLEDAAFLRMLIFRELNGGASNEQPALWPASRLQERAEDRLGIGDIDRRDLAASEPDSAGASRLAYDSRELEGAGEPRAEDMEIPADPDGGGALGDLLASAPSILDEMIAASRPAESVLPATYRQPQRAVQRGYGMRRGMQPPYGPGSRTRAIGLNDMAIGANDFGDGYGNVLRDNMRHFGITGTRAR